MLEPFLERRLEAIFNDNAPFHWFWEHLFNPLLRTILIIFFVLMIYPALFGLVEAPTVNQLLSDGHGRFNSIVGIVFFLTLALPLIPIFGRHPEFVMPLQGILATAVLFSWLVKYLGVTAASIWPGSIAALTILAFAYLTHRLAQIAASVSSQTLDTALNVRGMNLIVLRGVELIAQGPVVLLYGLALGQQISI